MRDGFVLLVATGMVVVATSAHAAHAPAQQPASPHTSARAFLDQYCVTCHNARLHTAGLTLDVIDIHDVPGGADVWEKVVRKLRTRGMPPAGRPRPDEAAYDAVASWLETEIDDAAATQPNPGRTEVFHRLNRTEYQNAVRDLLALDVDVASLLPGDDQSYGFDNIAGVLKVSPTLLERYMLAAREISRLAVGAPDTPPTAETFRIRSDLSQYDHIDGLPFGTRGGASIAYTFPLDAEYVLTIKLLDLFDATAALKDPHELELSIDGERVQLFSVGGDAGGGRTVAYRFNEDVGYEARVPLKAGPAVVTAAFVKRTSALSETVREPFARPHGEGDFLLHVPYVGTLTISGPFNATGVEDTPSRRRIFVCDPSAAIDGDEEDCARHIVSTLARRAYRRPVVVRDVESLLAFYDEQRAQGGGFEAGIEKALRALLVSPEFLFRVESDPTDLAANTAYTLGSLELASRLSFFLWSSIPDDELLNVAAARRLTDPAVLEQQVRRMLADPRATALAKNFAGQWLLLRNVEGVLPDDKIFPNFGESLRQDFTRETELFFDSILRDDRSVIDLLTADHTFLNERLAKHYGVRNVYGSDFRRVIVTDDNRRGLLGHGSLLTVTSFANRTSPVGRGKWILENILGTPPPPPPPDVPPLVEATTEEGRVLSMRERMVRHRVNPVCASCHARMDPLGFALENYDAVGRWRTHESGLPIDNTAELLDGTTFAGPAGLRAMLVDNPEQFATTVTEKLLTYALGRGLEYSDAPAVRAIVRGAADVDYSLQSLIVGIAQSTPFRMRQSAPAAAAAAPR